MANAVDQAAVASTKKGRFQRFLYGREIYSRHILGLLLPGKKVAVPVVHQMKPDPLEKWEEQDLKLMIEEGRRQLDRQFSDLEHTRSRAQWVFTVGAAVTASLAGALVKARPSGLILALWIVAVVILVYGVAGAAAVMVARADFVRLDTALMSRWTPPILKELATSYSRMLGTGENTVAGRLTVLHEAVLYVVLGGILGLVTVLGHG
jgi:hypothetical protein